ncbi:MAG: ComEC/Rec2 family competence protein, partial [Alphaproteobacteria bacterium]|nr:ComEC/Rec2 family competence protein [Alphaproteobacteria bacterium]
FDRRGISLRTLAIAASVILLLFPEVMLGASFQLSFAATLAIISFYEAFGRMHAARGAWWSLPAHHMLGIICTSLAATLATIPFTLYQFNRFATFAVIGNIVAIPIATLVIMPAIVLSLLLMPLGLQWLAYPALKAGIGIMLSAAFWTSALPMAAMLLPAPTTAGLMLAAFGLLFLCLMRARWRLLGVPAMIIGVASAALNPAPDLLISRDGRQVMARLPDGRFTLLKGSFRSFTAQAWLRAAAAAQGMKLSEADATLCDGGLCTIAREGRVLRFAKTPEALAVACATPADVVAALWKVESCPSAGTLLDRESLTRFGAHALYVRAEGVRVESVYTAEETPRPWMVRQGFTDIAE